MSSLVTASPDDLLATANELHRAGRLGDAYAMLEELVSIAPDRADGWCLRGDVLADLGHAEAAIDSYDRAIAADAAHADAYDFKAIMLLQLGRLEEGLTSLGRALALKPDNANALNNHGTALKMLGRVEEALASFDRAIAIVPEAPALHNNRGNALLDLERYEEAVAAYDAALSLAPDLLDAVSNRALALGHLGRDDEAKAGHGAALRINPDQIGDLLGLGEILLREGRSAEALACYNRVLRLDRDHLDGLFGRARALDVTKRFDEAEMAYKRVLAVAPEMIGAINNLALLLSETGRREESISYCDRAIALKPEIPLLYLNRSVVLKAMGDWDAAVSDYDRLLALRPDYPDALGMRLFIAMHLCRWDDFEAQRDAVAKGVAEDKPVIAPFPAISLFDDPALVLVCARSYVDRKYAGDVRAAPAPRSLGAGERLRIGYFSCDFREHPLMHLMAEVLEEHDRTRFEVAAFSYGPDTEDEWRRQAERSVDQFVECAFMTDRQIADRAREMGIDVAVDLTGLSQNGRLGIFAGRAAPVQASYLGFVGTMGAPFVDYIIADDFTIPAAEAAHYSEQVAYVPGCYQANVRERAISGKVTTRRDHGLDDGAMVYCCFNQSFKILPETFDAWMTILARVPGSQLWLWVDHPDARENLRDEAARRGVAPDRLVFAPRLPIDEHLARLIHADLFLDTGPYNAGTTASDALRMGVPVLTRAGRTMSARMAGSLLHAMGLPDLVTGTFEEYVDMGVALGADPARLAEVKARLAAHGSASSLFDSQRLTRHLEQLYAEMHRRVAANSAPSPIRL